MRDHYKTILKHDVGGSADMNYVTLRFSSYRKQNIDGHLYLMPCYEPGDDVLCIDTPIPSGQQILIKLYNLYAAINSYGNKKSYDDMILHWCLKYMHPYDSVELHSILTNDDYSYEKYAEKISWEGRFSVDKFREDLAKLYNHFSFYLALEDLKKGETKTAYNLYREGKFTDTYFFFESYKHKDVEREKIGKVSDDPVKQLMAEMAAKPINADIIKKENKQLDKEKRFATVPRADDPELQFYLQDMFPSFKMRVKAIPDSDIVTFAADVDSVFEIAWYSFARLLTTDVSELEDYRGYKPKACQYCGMLFTPKGPRQEYCDEWSCQAARKRKNRRDCDARKRQAEQED